MHAKIEKIQLVTSSFHIIYLMQSYYGDRHISVTSETIIKHAQN